MPAYTDGCDFADELGEIGNRPTEEEWHRKRSARAFRNTMPPEERAQLALEATMAVMKKAGVGHPFPERRPTATGMLTPERVSQSERRA